MTRRTNSGRVEEVLVSDGDTVQASLASLRMTRVSAARASASARSSVTSRKLRTLGSIRSILSRHPRVRSTGEICFAAIWRAASAIDGNGGTTVGPE